MLYLMFKIVFEDLFKNLIYKAKKDCQEVRFIFEIHKQIKN